MKDSGACAPGLALPGVFFRARVFPTVRYVPKAGPSASRVRTPGSWAKFLGVRSSTDLQHSDPHGSTLARISAPRCVNQHLSEDGRMDGCMDVDSK
ncbi:hypothetical protein PBY51_008115 [Eleginops maclovinus]|uniref:Uncharacterized protein n=1 Tax=Eleginops maclovinus TaxID=56733 RepID=A0AAN8ABI0_ELEMC|nr:hypothetical protein PBY51_008115 [Eleginops maclovinus]